jgi:hypothetical protein
MKKNVEIGHFTNADLLEESALNRTRIDVEPIEKLSNEDHSSSTPIDGKGRINAFRSNLEEMASL